MGTGQRSLLEEDRKAILKTVQLSDEPLDPNKIAKLADSPSKLRPLDVMTVLDEFTAEGVLRQFPPKTAKGKPRYWDRDPIQVCATSVIQAVAGSEIPVTAKEAVKLAKLPLKLSDNDINTILQRAVQVGQIHEIPPKTAKAGPRYWHSSDLVFARQTMLDKLNSKGPQPATSLKNLSKWLKPDQFQQIISELKDSRSIFLHPPVGSSKRIVYGSRPPAPSPYLKDVTKRLKGVVDKLKMAEVSDVELRRSIVEMLDAVGIQHVFRNLGTAPAEAPAESSHHPESLVELMRTLDPAVDRGALITSRVLRTAANLPKHVFDQMVLELARSGIVALHRHDFPSSLSEEKRDELVTDGKGNYFVGIALKGAK